MQLGLISFSLLSLALLARASHPFDEDSLDAREFEEALVERRPDGWDDIDPRDFLIDDEDFISLEARSEDALTLEEFTTRELLDELSDRILEARDKPAKKVKAKATTAKKTATGKGAGKAAKGKGKAKQSKAAGATAAKGKKAAGKKSKSKINIGPGDHGAGKSKALSPKEAQAIMKQITPKYGFKNVKNA